MAQQRPWKTKMERDIIQHEDLKVSGLQGGKALGEHMALFSFIMGIPLLAIGIFGLIHMVLGLGFPMNAATIILVLVVLSLGVLFTYSGIILTIAK